MSDTPRTDAAETKHDFEGDRWVKSYLARELERELAQRTAEVAALKKADPLAEMWRELAEYQERADRDGHGESWARMCEERTKEAASNAVWGAHSAWQSGSASRACLEAQSAAAHVAEQAGFMRCAINAIRRAKEER